MADSKKYDGNTWEHSLRKLGTATDTLTTLPADLYADGNNATVGLVGNMQQTGSPTPQNPIQPSECGDLTGNLFDVNDTSKATTTYCTISVSGGILTQTNVNTSTLNRSNWKIDGLQTGSSYILSMSFDNPNASEVQLRIYDENNNNQLAGNTVTRATTGEFSVTFTASALSCYVRIYSNTSSTINEDTVVYSNIMLNTGSTALPYEPYGYKIPISSANTTTPVYLGEVESTRQIKQVVLTGQEDLSIYGASTSKIGFYFAVNDMMSDSRMNGYSSHFKAQITPSRSTIDGITFGASNRIVYVTFSDTSVSALNLSDITSIKQYIADQYSAGTPVTIWYVLATPTTGIVNEPIRKIGNYADEVSGISIPTITGKDTFDVQTTLKPSEVSLTYTGWHDASVGEWDGSQWQ